MREEDKKSVGQHFVPKPLKGADLQSNMAVANDSWFDSAYLRRYSGLLRVHAPPRGAGLRSIQEPLPLKPINPLRATRCFT